MSRFCCNHSNETSTTSLWLPSSSSTPPPPVTFAPSFDVGLLTRRYYCRDNVSPAHARMIFSRRERDKTPDREHWPFVAGHTIADTSLNWTHHYLALSARCCRYRGMCGSTKRDYLQLHADAVILNLSTEGRVGPGSSGSTHFALDHHWVSRFSSHSFLVPATYFLCQCLYCTAQGLADQLYPQPACWNR